MGDRRHRRPVRCRVGCDRGRSDHRDVGRIDGRGPDNQRDPTDRTACRHPFRCAPATDWSGRIRRWTCSDRAGGGPYGEDERESSPPLRMRPTCAAEWVRRRSKWMRRRTAPGRRSGAPPSPLGCPASTGRNDRCSSWLSMPIPVNRSCSTATAESNWWTPSPPAVPARRPSYSIGDNRYIDGGYRADENADLAAGYGRVLVISPLGGRTRKPLDWGIHLAAQVDELRARGSRVETIFPDSNSRNAFGVESDGSVDASARRSSRLQPRQSPCRAAHRILALTTPPRPTVSATRSRSSAGLWQGVERPARTCSPRPRCSTTAPGGCGTASSATRSCARPRPACSGLGVDAIDLYQIHWPDPDAGHRGRLGGLGRVEGAGPGTAHRRLQLRRRPVASDPVDRSRRDVAAAVLAGRPGCRGARSCRSPSVRASA